MNKVTIDRELREECERLSRMLNNVTNDGIKLADERDTLRQQRDKLAGLLRKVLVTHDYHTDDGAQAADEAHDALAEVDKQS